MSDTEEEYEAKATFTPGPWDYWDIDQFGFHVFAEKFGDAKKGQDCRLSIAAIRSGRSNLDHVDNFYEGIANARLISAAPDLLAACEHALAFLEERIAFNPSEVIRDALKKARRSD